MGRLGKLLVPNKPYSIPSFGGGLNLRDKADAVDPGEAIDLLNVQFTDRGAVEQRPGYATFTDSALTNKVESMTPFYKTDGTARLIAGCGTRLEVLGTDGAVVSSGSATGLSSGGIWDFARFGAPAKQQVYAGNGIDTIQQWDETAHWTSGAALATVDTSGGGAMPKAGALCVQPNDNRLVAARYTTATGGPGGAISNPSYVYFSDAGDPTTWTSTNFVQLRPGDGESITAVVAWKEFVFIFKETSFYVFYGNSVDSEGAPVFDYRTVDAGVGALGPRAVAAGREGVYFASERGIYRTTGQEPVKVSDVIDPFFDVSQVASDFYLGGTALASQRTNIALGYIHERLYVGVTTSGTANDRTLVYDPEHDWWSLWDLPASCFASFRVSSNEDLMFGYSGGTKDVGRQYVTATNDNDVAITSRWRSGWYDFGNPAQKRIRGQKVWGDGRLLPRRLRGFQAERG